MKKLFTFCFVLFAGAALFAQKPINVAVYEDLSAQQSRDNDSRTGNLIQEYFKSELATHSGIQIVQSENLTNEKLTARGFKRGAAMTQAQIAGLCKDLKADYFCFVHISRTNDNKLESSVRIFKADGTKKSEFKRDFKSVRQSDFASILLARDAAVSIRGANPVDDVNLNQMKKHIQEFTTEKEKEKIRENVNSVK